MSNDRLNMDFGVELIDNGTSDDYYTPPFVFEALDLKFDIDVCAPAGGVPWIPAKRHFSVIDDGLGQDWIGKVWMNPPYSKVTPWIDKFINHGNGVALIPAMKSYWWKTAWDKADAILALPTDIKWIRADGRTRSIMFTVMLVAMGEENVQSFHNSGLGRVR